MGRNNRQCDSGLEKFLPPLEKERLVDRIARTVKAYAWENKDYNFNCKVEVDCADLKISVNIVD